MCLELCVLLLERQQYFLRKEFHLCLVCLRVVGGLVMVTKSASSVCTFRLLVSQLTCFLFRTILSRLPQPPDGWRIVMNRLSELSSGNIPSLTTNLRVEDAPSQWTRANKVKRDFIEHMSD